MIARATSLLVGAVLGLVLFTPLDAMAEDGIYPSVELGSAVSAGGVVTGNLSLPMAGQCITFAGTSAQICDSAGKIYMSAANGLLMANSASFSGTINMTGHAAVYDSTKSVDIGGDCTPAVTSDATTNVCMPNDVEIQGEHHLYGEAYLDPPTTQAVGIAAAGQNVWVEVDGCTSGELSGFTHSGCDFTAAAAGVYSIKYSISYLGGNGKTYGTGISINDTISAGCRTVTTAGATARIENAGDGGCIVTLAASDVVKIEMRGTDATTADATVYAITYSIYKL